MGSLIVILLAGILPVVVPADAPHDAVSDYYEVHLLPGRGEARITFWPGDGGAPAEQLLVSGDDTHAFRVEPGNSYLFPESRWDRSTGNRQGPFTIAVTTREDEAVRASGHLTSRDEAGEPGFRTTRFSGGARDRGLGLYVVARPAMADGGFPPGPAWAEDILNQALEILSDLFGALPSGLPAVIVVDYPRPLAKALPGALFLDRRLVQRNGPPPASRVAVLAHEAGHLWWPNRVRSRGPGASALHEGLAEFGACRVVRGILSPAAEEARWQALRDEYMAASESMLAAGVSLVHRGRGGDYGRALRYARSAWVVRMLAARVGEKAFREGLAGILAGRWDLSWDGLTAALATTSGVDLGPFHATWIAQPGHPDVQISRQPFPQPPVLHNEGGGGGELPVGSRCDDGTPITMAWMAIPPGEERPWPGSLSPACSLVVDPVGRFLVGSRGPAALPGLTLGRAWGFPVVTSVADGSQADVAGLRRGDLIVDVDGQPQDETRVNALVRRMSSGIPLRLRVRRGQGELVIVFQPPGIQP
ncbi:MAG: PDZ domain-containing protein [Acidobacteria bacterium]|nr:PDZ domain-containing protein [Acidobacteriota bacterium]